MRNVINKGLTEEVILSGAWEAFQGGWNRVKLYFMLGLPGEREDDIEQIAVLAEKLLPNILNCPKKNVMDGRRSWQVRPFLYQNHLPHSNGRQCVPVRSICTGLRFEA